MIGEVGFDGVVGAESAHDDVLHPGLLGLLQRHQAATDLLHDEGVVAGELRDLILADEINSAIADIGNREEAAIDCDRYDGGSHAGVMRVSGSRFVN